MDVAGPVEVEHNSHIVGIVGGIESADIEETLASEAITKIRCVQCRCPVGRQLSCHAMAIGTVDVCSLPACSAGDRMG